MHREDVGCIRGQVRSVVPEGWPALEIGYSFQREFWGRGFASEAARACGRYAYGVLQAPGVISLVHPDNLRRSVWRTGQGDGRAGNGCARLPVRVFLAATLTLSRCRIEEFG